MGISGDAVATAGLLAGCDAWHSVLGGTLPRTAASLTRDAAAAELVALGVVVTDRLRLDAERARRGVAGSAELLVGHAAELVAVDQERVGALEVRCGRPSQAERVDVGEVADARKPHHGDATSAILRGSAALQIERVLGIEPHIGMPGQGSEYPPAAEPFEITETWLQQGPVRSLWILEASL